MQLPGDLAQRRFARGDQLLRQLAPSIGERGELGEQPPVRPDQVQAGCGNGGERGGEEAIHLSLDVGVDVLHLLRGLFLGRVVLDEQPRDRGAERRLPRLQRQPDLGARFRLLSGAGQVEDAVRGVPELRHRGWPGTATCSGGPAGTSDLFLALQRVVQIEADAIELRRPRDQRIGLAGVQHVAHRERELIQIVLDAQQLQRVAAVPIGEIGLQTSQARRSGRRCTTNTRPRWRA